LRLWVWWAQINPVMPLIPCTPPYSHRVSCLSSPVFKLELMFKFKIWSKVLWFLYPGETGLLKAHSYQVLNLRIDWCGKVEK
jgi:hypothetical protein